MARVLMLTHVIDTYMLHKHFMYNFITSCYR